MKWYENIFFWLTTVVIRYSLAILGFSCRIKNIEGKKHIDEVIATGKSVIFSFWHNNILFCTHFLYKYAHKKGVHLIVLISSSKDGELIARVVENCGGTAVRGSTTRGGHRALFILYKKLKSSFRAVVTTPDGPKGPKYHFQEGSIILARLANCPIIPVHSAYSRKWVFNSWDNFEIPKPFSRVSVKIGAPYNFSENTKDKTNQRLEEEARQELEKIMLRQAEENDKVIKSWG